MKRELKKRTPEAAAPSPGEFDLGTWLGRRQAFGMMAGRASAADAECLRRIRDQKLYKSRTSRWGEFCARYLGASKTHVDRVIRQLEEFGPEFFCLTQLMHISPETYRAIAPRMSKEGLRIGHEVIALIPENSEKVSAAVAELRRQSGGANGGAAREDEFAVIEKRLEDLIARLDALPGSLEADQKISLGVLLLDLRDSAAAVGVKFYLA